MTVEGLLETTVPLFGQLVTVEIDEEGEEERRDKAVGGGWIDALDPRFEGDVTRESMSSSTSING